jgi:hypothetical protein
MSHVLERGGILFFYRPRVHAEEADAFEDVQRFFIVLRPAGMSIELVLIGAARHAEAELGIDLDTEQERLETADILRDLRILEPLQQGTWR